MSYIDNTTGNYVAQGAAYLDLSAPQNQWVIADINEDGEFVFANREDASITFPATLRATDKANIYEIVSSSQAFYYAETVAGVYGVNNTAVNFAGQKVKLDPVTVDPAAGFVDFTKTDLIDQPVLNLTLT